MVIPMTREAFEDNWQQESAVDAVFGSSWFPGFLIPLAFAWTCGKGRAFKWDIVIGCEY